MSIGYLYILSNSAMPGLLKIGITTREDVKKRVGELSSATGVPSGFELEYFCLTRRVEEVEKDTHNRLASARIRGREFFRIDLEAVRVVDSLVDQDIKPHRFCSVVRAEAKPRNIPPVDWRQAK